MKRSDSSRRAVEAADNVVYAYDFNMQVPNTPDPLMEIEGFHDQTTSPPVQESTTPAIKPCRLPLSGTKRRRSNSIEWNTGPLAKHRAIDSTESARSSPTRAVSPLTASAPLGAELRDTSAISSPTRLTADSRIHAATQDIFVASQMDSPMGASLLEPGTSAGLKHTSIRGLLRLLINDSLRVGGRPESAIAEDTERGEIIEVRSRSSKGDAFTKIVEWSVDPLVPEEIYVDERDLAKLISVVFLNALKFTESGKIRVTVCLGRKDRYVVINVKDTGAGIPQAFRPSLFKAFAREDDSLTRQREGLGLGLLVAKGLARRIGGDLVCVNSATEGPDRGSEFEFRVPLSPLDAGSRASTPSRNSTPTRLSIDRTLVPGTPDLPSSPLGRRQTAHAGTTDAKTSNPSLRADVTTVLLPASDSRRNSPGRLSSPSKRRGSARKPPTIDRNLAKKHPLTFLVAEDNKINRKLLVSMLAKFGYNSVHEAFDGAEAVRLMTTDGAITGEMEADVILMDLWMPNMDGYEATKRILAMERYQNRDITTSKDKESPKRRRKPPIVVAVSADVTDEALERATKAGMVGFMTKPYKLMDLERLILLYCTDHRA